MSSNHTGTKAANVDISLSDDLTAIIASAATFSVRIMSRTIMRRVLGGAAIAAAARSRRTCVTRRRMRRNARTTSKTNAGVEMASQCHETLLSTFSAMKIR